MITVFKNIKDYHIEDTLGCFLCFQQIEHKPVMKNTGIKYSGQYRNLTFCQPYVLKGEKQRRKKNTGL